MHGRRRHRLYRGERVGLEDQLARCRKRGSRTAEDVPKVIRMQNARLSEQQHREVVAGPEGSAAQIGEDVADPEPGALCLGPGVGDRCWREIDPRARVAELGESLAIETGSATEIQYRAGRPAQKVLVNPGDVGIDGLRPPTGSVVLLR